MRKTITIDIINDQAMALIKDLEALELIEIHKEVKTAIEPTNIRAYKGKMSQQPLRVVEEQLDELRNSWE